MKVAIITDTHYGARKNSKLFHDYFLKFYNDIFFPTIDEEGISTILHLGDAFDNRTGINFAALSWAKNNIFDPIKERGINVHLIVGNHDSYYKNTNDVNAVDLLLREYDNVNVYSETTEILVDKLKILFVPWINAENESKTLKLIEDTDCKISMGHLELAGFAANKQVVMDHGYDRKLFDKFEKVFSGHYHTRSTDGKITYLGNPYEMFWNDVEDTRGFHIFDTDTLELTTIDNPYRLFYKLYYNDESASLLDSRPYKDKIVKVIVRNKPRPKEFEKVIDKLYSAGVADLKIIENFGINENEEFEAFETEDTLSILNRYIEESEIDLDKSKIQCIMRQTYQEACEMI